MWGGFGPSSNVSAIVLSPFRSPAVKQRPAAVSVASAWGGVADAALVVGRRGR